jgi:hypothetical protein
MSTSKISAEEAMAIADEAYVFGYPLVLMEITRRVMTAVPKTSERKSPMNQFLHLRKFPDPTFTVVVSPNADTLYSSAWIDLAKEPIVLSVPSTGNRYYLMQMLDAWTNVFACPGTRTTGNEKNDFAIVGPGWKGTLPQGLHEIKSPTNMVWIAGRTLTKGKDDYSAVHAIQDQYRLTPLSAWGRDYTPPDDVLVEKGVDTRTPPVQQVSALDAVTFFTYMNALMKENPPAAADATAMKRFATIGVAPGKPFNLQNMELDGAEGLGRGIVAGQARITREAAKPQGKQINGWDVMTNVGRYGTNYVFRAIVALVGLGANLPEDAIYPRATKDADGQSLMGTNRYVIRFPKDQLPPVGAFWSITLYDSKQFFVQNPINRYAIGDRDKLKFDADGSLTLYVQQQSPGADKESNWLPAPNGNFNLFMRLYSPKKEILDGTWKPPVIQHEGVAPGRKVA